MQTSELKNKLLQKCMMTVEQQIVVLQQSIAEAQAAANEDTKSSAGDKYETTRAMMQIEIQNLSKRMAENQHLLQILHQIQLQSTYPSAVLGSIVTTSLGRYFLAIGLGKINVDGVDFFVVSPQSPIGAKLHHTRLGDEIVFNNKVQSILAIE